jgi:hypothetical protein
MKKIFLVVLLFACFGFMTGCATVASPLAGVIYTDVKAPVTATSNSASAKVGSATASSILGLIAMGDASIETAAKNAGIKHIQHVDYHSTTILGIYSTFTVDVYGE